MTELHALGATALLQGYQRRDFSPVEVLRSVLAHIEKMFKLRPLSMRDTAAASLDDAIDQDRLARREPAPPISLPPILIDAAEVEKACEQAPHLGPPSDILALADTGYFGKLDLRHRQRELLYAIGDRLEKYGMGGIRRG